MKLEETLGVLFDANVEFVLIGGAAMQMRGSAHLRNHRELNFTLMTDLGALDFLGEVADVGDYVEVKKNSDLMAILEMDLPGPIPRWTHPRKKGRRPRARPRSHP